MVGLYRWFWDVQVIDYGDPAKTYFACHGVAPCKDVSPGERVELWFTDARWIRLWKSTLHVRVTCRMPDPLDPIRVIDGRIDSEPHEIDLPDEPGPVPPKHRSFVVPTECLSGPLTWSANAISYGGLFGDLNPRRAEPPKLQLMVR